MHSRATIRLFLHFCQSLISSQLSALWRSCVIWFYSLLCLGIPWHFTQISSKMFLLLSIRLYILELVEIAK